MQNFLLLYIVIISLFISCSGQEIVSDPTEYSEIGAFEFPGGRGRVLISDDNITTAELLTVVLEVYTQDGTIALIPDIPEKMGDLTVVEQTGISMPVLENGTGSDMGSQEPDGGYIFATGKTFTIAPFLPGMAEVDPLEMQYKNGDGGDWESLFTGKIPFAVTSVIFGEIEKAPFRDSAEPGGLNGLRLWQLILIISLAVIILGVCLYIFVIRKPKEFVKEIIPPDVTAFKELEILKKEELAEKGEYNLYYTKLTEVIRHYIDGRFNLTTSEQTTEEFIKETLGAGVFSIEQKGFLKDFLIRSDIIKFADGSSTFEKSKSDYQHCWDIVQETKSRPEDEDDDTADLPDTGGDA